MVVQPFLAFGLLLLASRRTSLGVEKPPVPTTVKEWKKRQIMNHRGVICMDSLGVHDPPDSTVCALSFLHKLIRTTDIFISGACATVASTFTGYLQCDMTHRRIALAMWVHDDRTPTSLIGQTVAEILAKQKEPSAIHDLILVNCKRRNRHARN